MSSKRCVARAVVDLITVTLCRVAAAVDFAVAFASPLPSPFLLVAFALSRRGRYRYILGSRQHNTVSITFQLNTTDELRCSQRQ